MVQRPKRPRLYAAAMSDAPLVLTPRQAAERLGVGLATLRKHAATWEVLTGEHLERLWSEVVVGLLSEALAAVHRQEAVSVEGALRALHPPEAPLPVPLLDTPEGLRLLIREEVRAVVREELRAALASMPPALAPSTETDAVRLAVREELEVLRVRLHAGSPAPRRGLLGRLWAAWRGPG